MSKTLRILLIAGHGAGDPGACGYGTEATETRRVVNELKSQFAGYDVQVDVYDQNRNAYADIGNGCLQVNFADYDYVFEIHFNSAANTEATGVEVWVTPDEGGITVEKAVVNKVAALGYSNRGVKREDFRVIRTAKNKGTSAALIETCFISNKSDMNKYNSSFSKVCNAMVEGIVEGFNIKKKAVSNVNINVKGEYEMKYIVQYENDVDRRAAEYLADSLKCPTIDSKRPFDYSKIENVIAVGGGSNFSSYTKYHIKGADRYETATKTLEVAKDHRKLENNKK